MKKTNSKSKTIFPFQDFQNAFRTLKHSLSQKPGYTLLYGESGTGKTTLLRHVSQELDRSRFQLLYLCHGRPSPSALARVLADALHLPLRRTRAETSRLLTQTLKNLPSHLLLWIDEAQLISDDTLHEIRLMAEADLDGPPLFSVILSALPSLKERLLAPQLFPLWRRFSAKLSLSGLLVEEVKPFLSFHFTEIQIQRFSDDAIAFIFEQARGIPALLYSLTKECIKKYAKGNIGQQQIAELFEHLEG